MASSSALLLGGNEQTVEMGFNYGAHKFKRIDAYLHHKFLVTWSENGGWGKGGGTLPSAREKRYNRKLKNEKIAFQI